MLKKNNFVKFIFSLLLLLSIFAFSFSVSNNVVEASTVESKHHNDYYEYIYFTPLKDIDVGEFSITFQCLQSSILIFINWNYLDNTSEDSYRNSNGEDAIVVSNPIAYEAGVEYCITLNTDIYYGISDVSSVWSDLGITHCYFNYFRFTSDFEVPFLYSSCVEAEFLECYQLNGYYCNTINANFFNGCSFEEIYLPLKLKEIYLPFNFCYNLRDIYFRTLPVVIEGVANSCYNLENYWLEDSNGEFYSTQLLVDDTTLYSMIGGTIPTDISYIAPYCFSSFESDTLIIPSTVSSINNEAFYSAIIGDLIFTSQVPPVVNINQEYEELNRIIVPYVSYDTYIIQDFFADNFDIVFRAEIPFIATSLITSIISILLGGISSLSYGIGSGLTDLVSSIFVSSNGGLSLFGGVVIVFAGLSLAIGLCRLIISFITSLGGDD